jgi:uncharacterized membrane protein YqhA
MGFMMSDKSLETESPRHESMMSKTPTHHMSGRVAGLTRFIIIAPVIGLFVAAVVLTALASIDVVRTILEVFARELSLKQVLVAFIEEADIYLLAIVLYIISLGLYELFIDENVNLPGWLRIQTLEDLKEKLVSVVVVVLAVYFLGKVIEAKDPRYVLELGAGIALMIAALGYFVSRVLLHGHE